ncbi:hypothetical protein Y032_0589g365 [Ancylostoma ceylanicum]|uniref:Uncharacterized protein n=1 Tax=Ancylostoma ceylanicum TaxID=53326 RepID=A0A016WM74_9BILA|nr:hypothetical protein Y032_0589g365 [Ancylostoma ceylanicum]
MDTTRSTQVDQECDVSEAELVFLRYTRKVSGGHRHRGRKRIPCTNRTLQFSSGEPVANKPKAELHEEKVL